MPTVELPQGATHYEIAGSGPALVLIHGMGGDHTVWDGQVEGLRDHFLLIRPDILGHGRTHIPPAPWRYAQFSRQIAELLDHLSIQGATICGFSLGGLIAQSFAIDYPQRAAALIVVSSACERTAAEQEAVDRRVEQVRAGGAPAVVDGALQRWFTPEFVRRHPEVIAYWRAKTLANDPAAYRAVYELYADSDRQLLNRLGAIRAPTLIVTGDRDPGQTPRMAAAMASRIRGAEMRVLPGVPHMLPIEAAEALNGAVRDFHDRLARRANEAGAQNG
jgi:3-oxoadipate enol-lactonase